MKEFESHPAAKLFPLVTPPELENLAEDIKSNGLLNPIIIHENLILDGRNRYLACKKAGVEPVFQKWNGQGSPTQWVLSINLHRRHLSASQRAAIATEALPMFEAEAKERQIKLAQIREAQKRNEPDVEKIPPLVNEGKARDKAAAATGANPRYVSEAKRIKAESPEVFEQVLSGDVTIAQAKKKLPPPPFKPATEVTDKEGWPVPKDLVDLWNRGREADELLKAVSELRSKLKKAEESKDPLFAEANFNSMQMSLDSVYSDLKRIKPHAVCTACNGKLSKTCTLCHGRGLISKFLYDACAIKEHKERRRIILEDKSKKKAA